MARTEKPKHKKRTGYNPLPNHLRRINLLHGDTSISKTVIRDRAMQLGLDQITNDPTLLLEKAA